MFFFAIVKQISVRFGSDYQMQIFCCNFTFTCTIACTIPLSVCSEKFELKWWDMGVQSKVEKFCGYLFIIKYFIHKGLNLVNLNYNVWKWL